MKAQLLVGTIALSVLLAGCASESGEVAELQSQSANLEVSPGDWSGPSSSSNTESELAKPTQGAKTGPLATLEIEANQSDEDMARDIIDTFSSWHMAGATPEAKAVRSSEYGHLTLEAYAEKIAREQTPIYATALYGKDYASNALLMVSVSGFEQANKSNVLAFLQTSSEKMNPANKEPYAREIIFEDYTALPAAAADKSFAINYHEVDNSDKNIIGPNSKVSGLKGTITMSLQVEDTEMLISLIQFTSR